MAPFVGDALAVAVTTISCGGAGNSPLKNMIVSNKSSQRVLPSNALT